MGSVVFDVHTLVIGMAAILVGTQVVVFPASEAARDRLAYCHWEQLRYFSALVPTEYALLFADFGAGRTRGIGVAVWDWSARSFGALDYSRMMRLVVPAVTLLAVGVQIAMAAFLSSILDLKISKT
jgi:hypothetical protein